MVTVLRYGLRRFRGQIIGWGIGLLLLGLMMTAFYPTIVEEQALFEQLMEAYPPEFFAFFGGLTDFAQPEGYLSIEFFSYMPLVLGIFGVLAGSGLLVSDEENGTMDLVLAHPVSRSALFAGRFIAFLIATAAILAIGWAGLVLPTLWITFEIDWVELLLPLFSLGLQILIFATLALL
ncbi:MAG: ABC transporter permease, partial [Anaerolineae bacterium]